MAIVTNFYPDGKTIYQADNFRAPWASLLTDGVFSPTDYVVTADNPADLAVSVSAGAANKLGYYIKSDAAISVPITANTSGYNRIDIIVVDVDATNCVTTVKAVQGTPSSSPVAPVAAGDQLILAQVTIGNNASVIDGNVIVDVRRYANPKISIGEIKMCAGAALPGTFLCDGSAFDEAAYPLLYAYLGNNNTLPDMRGCVPGMAGGVLGTALGATVGSDTHTIARTELPHEKLNMYINTTNSEAINDGLQAGGAFANRVMIQSGLSSQFQTDFMGGGQPMSIIQKTYVCNFCIVHD